MTDAVDLPPNTPASAPVSLTAGQSLALANLGRKKAGQDVDWISIADARALTDLGLAERNREGWNITDAGLVILAAQDKSDQASPD